MKAVRFEQYGDPTQVLRLVDSPAPTADHPESVLVRVVAASLNPLDWHLVTGVPYIARPSLGFRPRTTGLGVDVAGVVEEVGSSVTGLAPGDAVFGMIGPEPGGSGMRLGSVAELVAVRERDLVPIPDGVSFAQAAGVGVAATTAWRALARTAETGPGDRVLVNGATGGVGSFAVQIAVARGAEAIAVCSTAKTDLARELGASVVVDYTTTDATEPSTTGGPVDVVLDNAGARSPADWRSVLSRDGTYIANFGRKTNRVVGPLGAMLRIGLLGLGDSRRWRVLSAETDREQLLAVTALLESGELRTVVGDTVDLVDAPAAMQRIADGHGRGKLIVRVREGLS